MCAMLLIRLEYMQGRMENVHIYAWTTLTRIFTELNLCVLMTRISFALWIQDLNFKNCLLRKWLTHLNYQYLKLYAFFCKSYNLHHHCVIVTLLIKVYGSKFFESFSKIVNFYLYLIYWDSLLIEVFCLWDISKIVLTLEKWPLSCISFGRNIFDLEEFALKVFMINYLIRPYAHKSMIHSLLGRIVYRIIAEGEATRDTLNPIS